MARGRRKAIVAAESTHEEKTEVCMTDTAVLESLETDIDRARQELERTKLEIEEKKAELKKMPAREIDTDEQKIIDKQINGQSKGESAKKIIEQQKAYDNVMVTGKFTNRRAPGQPAKLTYIKYPDDPVKWYTLEDGKTYTLPRGFVDQINDYYHMPRFIQRQGSLDPSAPQSQIEEVDTSNKKYMFSPVNF